MEGMDSITGFAGYSLLKVLVPTSFVTGSSVALLSPLYTIGACILWCLHILIAVKCSAVASMHELLSVAWVAYEPSLNL